jgi:stage III sporulation protein SpoIIIAA
MWDHPSHDMTHHVPTPDDLDLFQAILPPALGAALADHPDRERLIEVILDLGRLPEARFPARSVPLAELPVTRDDLDHVVAQVGTFGPDNRAGIERTLHRISALRNRVGEVVGLTCRVGRSVRGTVEILRDVIAEGSSTLLLGRPGVGKTTLLREAARVLADDLDRRVVVVDTSNEIAGDGDIPHPGIGRARRMQVPSPDDQDAVMIEAVENHSPEVVVIDEIGTEAEARAARTIAERGVQLIATAHGNSLDNLLQNPTLSDLVGGIQVVTLGDDEARRRGTQKTVLERKAPPTFDVVVEIHDRDRLAVHHDVAQMVDHYLLGDPLRPELRTRTGDGNVEIVEIVEIEEHGPAELPAPPGSRWPGLPEDSPEGGAIRREPARPARPAIGPGSKVPGDGRLIKIFPYAISRSKLERSIKNLGVPAYLVDDFRDADLMLTVKSQERRQPKRLRDAQLRGLRLEVVKSNTVQQMENFLDAWFSTGRDRGDETRALADVEQAIDRVLDGGSAVELAPQSGPLRRLQHEAVEQAGLLSEAAGVEPHRRVVVYPR